MSIFMIIMAGVLGTTAMIGAMSLLGKMKIANADMVRALGSVYTKSPELALIPGLVIHYFFGISFSFLYSFVIGFSPVQTAGSAAIICILAGLVHGLMVGLFLSVVVAEFHPVEQFRSAGLEVAAAHVVGHIFYGLTVGFFFYMSWEFIGEAISAMAPGILLGEMIGFSAIWIPLFGVPLLFVGFVIYNTVTDRVRIEAQAEEQEHEERERSAQSDTHEDENGRRAS